MGLIVAVDGSPAWRALRLLLAAAAALAVAALERRLTGRPRGLPSLVVGVVAGTAGATIGFSYLFRAGMSLKALGGLIAFAGGLAAIVFGTTSLLRPVRGWRRLLAVPVALVIALAAVRPQYGAVYATNVPRPQIGSDTPADHRLDYENASFETSDGVLLSGWYVPSSNGAAVVLLHGASSTRSNVLAHAVVFARNGYGVLAFDARGHGRSEGRAMEFGWYGELDTAAAVDYLSSRADVDPGRIGVVGMSMGGEEAIGAMAADSRIKAVIAEGATNRVLEDRGWLVEEFGVRGRIQQMVNSVEFALVDLLTEAPEPPPLREAVKAAAPRPVLLIAAGRVPDEQHAGRSIHAGSPETVSMWVVEPSGHTGGLRTQPEEWEKRVMEFLIDGLPAAGVR